MDNETILKLVNAGFTKEEITKMDAGTENKPEENKPAGDGAGEDVSKGNADAGAEQSAAGSEHESEITNTIKALTETVAGLSATVKAMQDANIKGASTPSANTGDELKNTIDSFIKTL